jgi:serine/threonine protein kinase
MLSCSRCQHELTPGALFCAFCGTAVPVAAIDGPAEDPFIGQTFRGIYFVQQRIGGGGMGQVYKGQHVTLESPVAIKILKKALLADPAVVQRFHREARAASRLRHRNVINVTDFGQAADGTLFMVMEYVAGRSLAEVISSDSPLPERRVVRLGQQILAALTEAHADGILHRDLKPENVMVESRREERDLVKVLDFGIAKILEPGEGQRTLTQDGLVCGTPGYMSPEQWEDTELDARSDLYAVGVILYEMLTGELPVQGRTPLDLVRKHLVEKPLPPSVRCPDRTFSPELEALVMRTLSVDRSVRPASAEEMGQLLLSCELLSGPDGEEVRETQETALLDRASPGSRAQGKGMPPVAGTSPRKVPPPVRRTPARTILASPDGSLPGGSAGRSRAVAIAVGVVAALVVAAGVAGVRSMSGREQGARPAPADPAPSAAPLAAAAPAAVLPPSATPAESPPPVVPAPPERPAPAPTAARPREQVRSREPVEVREALNAIATPAAATGQGVLSVQVEPYGDVLLDGRSYGEAPREFRLPSGSFVVVATHPQLGRRQERIEVRAGQRVTRTFDLSTR